MMTRRAQSRRRQEVLVTALSNDVRPGQKGPRVSVPVRQRVDRPRPSCECRHHMGSRACCQEAGAAEGKVVQMRRYGTNLIGHVSANTLRQVIFELAEVYPADAGPTPKCRSACPSQAQRSGPPT